MSTCFASRDTQIVFVLFALMGRLPESESIMIIDSSRVNNPSHIDNVARSWQPLCMPATRGPGPVPLTLSVNGVARTVLAPPRRTLLDALRFDLGLTAAKRVCDEGECGACTVIVDGRTAYACLLLAIDCEGRRIETLEGLVDGEAAPVIEAFVRCDALQCGFCTPGQVVAVTAHLREARAGARRVDEASVRRAVSGNLCRCGTYPRIVEAALACSQAKGGERTSP
jgi:xanthine dehydrogenase YagT iron-sulfur-binding subunit